MLRSAQHDNNCAGIIGGMSELRDNATAVVRRLVEAGHQAYWAGGCVRDLVLGREPSDYDVATSATPPEVLRLYPDAVTVGAQFGVIRVPSGGAEIEVATFRSDHGTLDGRHPREVRYARTPEEDVRRRDFTINGLLYDPIKEEVLDFVGGRADLQEGVIRTIGEPAERFAEDRLRLLRAIRFAARFGYRIEENTWAALCETRAGIEQVSRERVRDELLKMLTEGPARRAFELLDESGLLEILLPEVARMKGVEQPPEFHPEGDVWVHTLLMLERLSDPTPTLALGALLHDVGKPPTFTPASGPDDRIRFDRHTEVGAVMAEEICARLRLSNRDTERVVALVRHHLRFKDAPNMRPSTFKRFISMDGFDEHLELHRLDCAASHGDLSNWDYIKQQIANLPPEEVRPPRLLTGHDLQAMGYRPGPEMGKMLAALEEAQLEGTVKTVDEAQAFVRERFPGEGEG
ncbi:MAG TPA: CCA tRNA nucleotidyltransferase [Candidatus Acidoferrales bacterium]|nr:CCA tRNA nucleotidyltransferase [Candidatus Acidoferrales bacterium]